MTKDEKIIKGKLGLLELGKQLKNVSEACRTLGYSRDSYYRFKDQFENGGAEGLKERSRRQPNLRNRFPADVEDAIVQQTMEHPTWGPSASPSSCNIQVSPGGVRNVWLRRDLARMTDRLRALEALVAQSGGVLTEEQKEALERARTRRRPTASWRAPAPATAARRIRSVREAVPDEDGADRRRPPQRSRGAVLRGARPPALPDPHGPGEQVLRSRGPRVRALPVDRGHRPYPDEGVLPTDERHLRETLDALQEALDDWMAGYNTKRTHQGRWCFGRTPMRTFLDTLHLAREKILGAPTTTGGGCQIES